MSNEYRKNTLTDHNSRHDNNWQSACQRAECYLSTLNIDAKVRRQFVVEAFHTALLHQEKDHMLAAEVLVMREIRHLAQDHLPAIQAEFPLIESLEKTFPELNLVQSRLENWLELPNQERGEDADSCLAQIKVMPSIQLNPMPVAAIETGLSNPLPNYFPGILTTLQNYIFRALRRFLAEV